MWVKEDGFTEREEHRGRRGAGGHRRARIAAISTFTAGPKQAAEELSFCHSERCLRSEESAFSLAFCKKRSLASLGMTTNCDSSAACKSRALPKIASGARARRPRERGASESEESKHEAGKKQKESPGPRSRHRKWRLDNPVAAADRMARKVWGRRLAATENRKQRRKAWPRPGVGRRQQVVHS
jgi:hypothetical protein